MWHSALRLVIPSRETVPQRRSRYGDLRRVSCLTPSEEKDVREETLLGLRAVQQRLVQVYGVTMCSGC